MELAAFGTRSTTADDCPIDLNPRREDSTVGTGQVATICLRPIVNERCRMNGEADQAHARPLRVWRVRGGSSIGTIVDRLSKDRPLSASRLRELDGTISTMFTIGHCEPETPKTGGSVVVPVGLFNNRPGDRLETI